MDKEPNNQETDTQKDEIVLFEEETINNNNTGSNNQNSNMESSASVDEMISFEEYYLECCRFGEFPELKDAMKQTTKDFNVNYRDFNGNSALHMACANGHLDIVKYLIETLHIELDSQNKARSTSLNWAAINGQKEVVQYLIEKGADVTIKDRQGRTPSAAAFDMGHYEISEIIAQKEFENDKHNIKIEETTEDVLNEEMLNEDDSKKEKESK